MPMIDTTRAANINVVCGSSGSGKSWHVKDQIKKSKRLMIFDPDDEYGEENVVTVRTLRELTECVKAARNGNLRIRLVAGGAEKFDLFCKLAFWWCNCEVVAEEIAGVTTPQKAPQGWHTLISRGRKRGITIYAVTQRPSESDKTVLGNATSIRVGRMTRSKDRKYIAEELDVKPNEVTILKPLEFIQRIVTEDFAIKGLKQRGKDKLLSKIKLNSSFLR